MTTTNQAFIKIYRHDEAEPTPRASAATAMCSGPWAAASVEVVASAALHGSSFGQAAPNAAAQIDSIDVLGPPAQLAVDAIAPSSAPHATVKAPKSAPGARRAEPSPSSPAATTTSKRPLSTFIPRKTRGETFSSDLSEPGATRSPRPSEQIARPSGPAYPAENPTENRPERPGNVTARPGDIASLHPGTTVASFHWPEVCRVLSRLYGDELDRVASCVSLRAAAGKPMIGVLSLFPGGGGTTVALALAERLADAARTTILVDGNFGNPRVAASLDAVPTAGWQEVLRREATLADAIVRATDDHLDLLAITAAPGRGHADLVARDETENCARMLREAYGVAIIDLGPFFDPRSQTVVLELVRRMQIDAVIAVAGPQPADLRDLATIAEHLTRCGCELAGVIENRVVQAPAVATPHSLAGARSQSAAL